jgi:hypothetical protein
VRRIGGAPAVKNGRSTNSGHSATAEPAEYSVYFGRERLGRFVRLEKRKFEAFDRNDRALGCFRKRKDALGAIYAAPGESR